MGEVSESLTVFEAKGFPFAVAEGPKLRLFAENPTF